MIYTAPVSPLDPKPDDADVVLDLKRLTKLYGELCEYKAARPGDDIPVNLQNSEAELADYIQYIAITINHGVH